MSLASLSLFRNPLGASDQPATSSTPSATGSSTTGAKPSPRSFGLKDSGRRQEFASGMVRDVTEGKTFWSLVWDGPMLRRWAEHLTKGAVKYAKRNWMKAAGEEELERAKDSAARHFSQWMAGETDEDHAAAVFFNINLAEYVREKLRAAK